MVPVETTPMDALQTMPVGSDCFPSSSDALFFFPAKMLCFSDYAELTFWFHIMEAV